MGKIAYQKYTDNLHAYCSRVSIYSLQFNNYIAFVALSVLTSWSSIF